MNGLLATAIAFLLSAVPSQLFAKGETTKITIQGLYLKAPVEIVDPAILSKFNVWAGPGTWSSDPSFNANAPGFIVDWSSAAVSEVPDGRTSYKVSFYAKLPNERLAYWIDQSRFRGWVCSQCTRYLAVRESPTTLFTLLDIDLEG
ncbi:MAG: hypothetical protein WB660_21315 [Candidatus Sulfotelmatobacter sp.]